jgi:hypothetical protein
MYYRGLLVLLLLAGFTCRAQQNSDPETYVVRGTAVNSLSGEPIPGALVRLISNGRVAERQVRADAEGKFEFVKVAAGAGQLDADKPGYFAIDRGPEHPPRLTVAVQKDSPAAIVQLVPEGIIYGRVSGADGEPIERMQVQLLEKRVEDGKGRWVSGNVGESTLTDDEGRFRLAELRAGTYFLLAGLEHLDEIANGSDSGRVSQYGAMYYPGVSEFAAAAAIELSPGRHAEADVKLARQTLYRVSGVVEGAPAGSDVHLAIFNATGQGIGIYPVNRATGVVDATSVPTSASRLAGICEGSEGVYFGEMKLKLTADLTGVRLKMAHAPDIVVKVQKEITQPENVDGQKAESRYVKTTRTLVAAPLALVPEEADRPQGRYEAEPWGAQMVLRSVFPGSYRLNVDVANGPYYVASASIGEVDLLNEDLTVALGSALPAMEIVLRDNGANLAVLPQRNGVGVAGFILVWPLDAQMMIQARQSYVGTPARFDKLRPGRYRVLALEAGEQAEYRSAEFRQKYESKWQETTLQANQSATMKVELTKDLE